MSCHWFVLGALAVGVAVSPAATAQTMTEMTPAVIKQAIESGSSKSKVKFYGLKKVSKGPGGCEFLTPFLQVAAAASDAHKKGAPFGEADVQRDWLDGIVVHARTDLNKIWQPGPKGRGGDFYWYGVDAVSIVISKDGQQIKPSRVENVEYWWPASRVLNATPVRTTEMKAVFPRDVVSPTSEVVVTYQIHSVPEPTRVVFKFEQKQYK